MSLSSKNLPKMKGILAKNNMLIPRPLKREDSTEKVREHLSLKCAFYQRSPKKKYNKNLAILNFISNTRDRKYSAKTSISDSEKIDYELSMVKKYEENVDDNLSFISEFDLEAEENNLSDSFNSSDNDNSELEEIEIKSRKLKNIYEEDEENNIELEKEWNDIKDFILSRKK
jgi:hypothetical protein